MKKIILALFITCITNAAVAGYHSHCTGLMKSNEVITSIISIVDLSIEGSWFGPNAKLNIDGIAYDRLTLTQVSERVLKIDGIATATGLFISLNMQYQNSNLNNPTVKRTTFADFNGKFITSKFRPQSTKVNGLLTCLEND